MRNDDILSILLCLYVCVASPGTLSDIRTLERYCITMRGSILFYL